MKIYKSPGRLGEEIERRKRKGDFIGFVPTMGCLHDGHLSLIRQAAKDTGHVVISIFVNPLQFGPREDFKEYPRRLGRDIELCRRNDVDIVFIPQANSMYKEHFSTYVNVENLADLLCGASRPGHFKGVATVVAKLFNIVKPDVAYFGQKDAQQAIVIKKMVNDLNMPIRIKIMPTVREKDGLAISSRNILLAPEERHEAVALYRSLELAKTLYKRGEKDSKKIKRLMHGVIVRGSRTKIDYIAIVDIEGLKDVKRISRRVLVAVAAWVGKTRLIDNIILREDISYRTK